MNQLLAAPAQFEVTALARTESINKQIYKDLAARDALVKPANLQDVGAVATMLSGADVIISLYLPYTVIDVGLWYQVNIPLVPSGRLDDLIVLDDSVIFGGGNTKTGLIDIDDIGRYVARIISDPRTLNKMVAAFGQVTTQNEIHSIVEEVTGETIPRKYRSRKDLEETISATVEKLAQNPIDEALIMQKFILGYACSRGIRDDNNLDTAKYLRYLDAKELSPDVECTSFQDYIRQLVEGKRDAAVTQSALCIQSTLE
ncbi:isoflavone reductase [Pyricularia oryzae 70-15]|uniref:Isoflavone reductase n=1 Tax=Pyricularia oryzae (strain 70-15 / ATCC MYA-4617 / FGSC 8958) TaxID=242507 RepID=G4MQ12_PYRO7|nr:isoflavone reductase [Pyricularia oryzae 70-15]EHA58100.1 isoflavone reductase [Pyricularia oryzae 70-15]